jgi:hypothetical protein
MRLARTAQTLKRPAAREDVVDHQELREVLLESSSRGNVVAGGAVGDLTA